MPFDPYMHTKFTGGPARADEADARLNTDFKGKGIFLVGGSMEEDGMSPYDIKPNNAAGHPATASTIWGMTEFQGKYMGGDVV